MGMWDYDLGGKTLDDVEKSAGPLPDGHYKMRFLDTKPDPETGSQIVRMQVTYGPFAGKVHAEYLRSPVMAQTDAAAEMCKKIAGVYLKRFGIVPREAKAIVNPDWNKIVGQEGIMQIKNRAWQKDNKSGVSTEVPIGGVWTLDHPEVAAFNNAIRAAVGLPPTATGGSATAPPTATQGAGGAATPGGGANGGAAAPPLPTGAELAKNLWD